MISNCCFVILFTSFMCVYIMFLKLKLRINLHLPNTFLKSCASCSGRLPLLKIPLPNSNPAIAPAPSLGVMVKYHRKKELEL